MLQRRFSSLAFPVGACGAAILLGVAPAKGDEKGARVACNTAYKDFKAAQADEQAGHLRIARDLYQSCSRATCGGLVQKCSAKYSALNADLPSVVPIATDDSGEPRVDLQVQVDGEVVSSRLDGRGIPVEPGLHEFTFFGDRGAYATRKVMVIKGQKNRPIAVTLHSPTKRTGEQLASAATATKPPSPEAASTEGAPPDASREDASSKQGRSLLLPLAVGGAGLATLAAGGLLTYWGRRDNDALSQCSPSCSPSSVSHIRTLYALSDVSIGVGIAAVGVATWLWVSSGASKEQPAPQAVFDVNPTRSGAIASVRGAF